MLFFISPASYTACANEFHTNITYSETFCLLNILIFFANCENCKHMAVPQRLSLLMHSGCEWERRR